MHRSHGGQGPQHHQVQRPLDHLQLWRQTPSSDPHVVFAQEPVTSMCHSHSNLDDTNANSSRKFPLSLVFPCSPAASRCVTRPRPKLVRVPIQRLRYHRVALKPTRRNFLQLGVSGLAANLATDRVSALATNPTPPNSSRRFRYLLLDVFTTHRLQGNQLAVFL